MIPTHANKSGTRYRYYVSQTLIKQQRTEADAGWRIPAADLERLVEGRLTAFLASQTDMFDAIETSIDAIDEQKRLIEQAAACDKTSILTLTIAATLKRSGLADIFAIYTVAPKRPPDRSLLRLIAQAARYREIVLKGQGKPIKTLAAEAGVSPSYFTRVFRLSFLAPDIVRAILQGRQPEAFTAKRLSLDIKLVPGCTEQLNQLGMT